MDFDGRRREICEIPASRDDANYYFFGKGTRERFSFSQRHAEQFSRVVTHQISGAAGAGGGAMCKWVDDNDAQPRDPLPKNLYKQWRMVGTRRQLTAVLTVLSVLVDFVVRATDFVRMRCSGARYRVDAVSWRGISCGCGALV